MAVAVANGFGLGCSPFAPGTVGTVLGVPLAMGIGGSLDYISGRVVRAPAGWRRLGLEWLYRLIRQPWR